MDAHKTTAYTAFFLFILNHVANATFGTDNIKLPKACDQRLQSLGGVVDLEAGTHHCSWRFRRQSFLWIRKSLFEGNLTLYKYEWGEVVFVKRFQHEVKQNVSKSFDEGFVLVADLRLGEFWLNWWNLKFAYTPTSYESGCASAWDFHCFDSALCIPTERVCDWAPHCPYAEDERRCRKTTTAPALTTDYNRCQPWEFQCPNDRCVSQSWECDYPSTTARPNGDCLPWQSKCPDGSCVQDYYICEEQTTNRINFLHKPSAVIAIPIAVCGAFVICIVCVVWAFKKHKSRRQLNEHLLPPTVPDFEPEGPIHHATLAAPPYSASPPDVAYNPPCYDASFGMAAAKDHLVSDAPPTYEDAVSQPYNQRQQIYTISK